MAGCTQQGALNYNPLATVPTECVPRIEGCTLLVSGHLSAVNFDSTATVDDGSCRYTFAGCTDSTAINFDEFASVDDGGCSPLVAGCTDPAALTYDSRATAPDLARCVYPAPGCTDSRYANYDPQANVLAAGICAVPGLSLIHI